MTRKETLSQLLDFFESLLQTDTEVQHVETKDIYSGAIVAVDFGYAVGIMLIQITELDGTHELTVSLVDNGIELSDAATMASGLREAAGLMFIDEIKFLEDTLVFEKE